MNNKIIGILFFAIFFLSFMSATSYKQGDVIDLKIATNESSCHLTISYPNSSNILHEALMSANTGYANYTFNNSLSTGEYQYFSECGSGVFMVTPNGEEATTGKAVFYIGLLSVLLFFLGLSIYFFSDTDDLLTRVGSLGIAYLLLIAVTFIAWNMAKDFLTSSPFLIAMLNTLFIVFVIGAFPLLIGMFAYYLIMVFRIKEVQQLMDKGMDFNEANRRQGKKYK